MYERKTLAALALSALLILFLSGCGTNSDKSLVTGEVRLSLSDPPTCRVPAGDFVSVWVTVTRVRAHITTSAGPNDNGWVDLVDLTDAPVQVDLLSQPQTRCVLANLGSTLGLPPGDYQQIRLHLLSNNPGPGVTTPANNHCSAGFNCAMMADTTEIPLDLSSQDQTGLKIPPGRIAGGRIRLEADQSADINIDFNLCSSLVATGASSSTGFLGVKVGPKGLRLKPTLYAGEVSLSNENIAGRVVDSATGIPLTDATIFVFAETPDGEGIDRIVMQTRADATAGTFLMCPLPEGSYDIALTAMDGSGVTYHPTVTFNVPTGSNIGDIPVVAQPAPDIAPATLEGLVTSSSMMGGESINAEISPLQPGTPDGGTERQVTIPPLGSSTMLVATAAGATCPAATNCANYMLIVPAGNLSIGTFNAGGTSWSTPAGGDVLYSVNGRAFLAGSAHDPACSPSSVTVSTDTNSDPLKALSGQTTTVADINFTGCSTP